MSIHLARRKDVFYQKFLLMNFFQTQSCRHLKIHKSFLETIQSFYVTEKKNDSKSHKSKQCIDQREDVCCICKSIESRTHSCLCLLYLYCKTHEKKRWIKNRCFNGKCIFSFTLISIPFRRRKSNSYETSSNPILRIKFRFLFLLFTFIPLLFKFKIQISKSLYIQPFHDLDEAHSIFN